MGYERKKKVYRLKFQDPEMEGLEVDTTSTSIEGFMAVTDLSDLSEFAVDGFELTAENLAQVQGAMDQVNGLFENFAQHLVAWNLEENGEPVPATYEGIRTQDPEFILEIITAWMEAIGGVSGPKAPRSNDGRPSLEASIPMDALSPSRTPSSGPSLSSAAVSGSGASRAS